MSGFPVFREPRITLRNLRILIIKLGAIGDIIHTLPSLAAIRASFPAAEVSWVAEQRSAEILRGNRLLDNLIEVDTKSLRDGKVEKMLIEGAKQVKNLRQYDFDISIDFQGLLKSGVIGKLSGAKTRWGFARTDLREPAARVFYTDTLKIADRAHVIHRNLALAKEALTPAESSGEQITFPIFTADEHAVEAEAIARRRRPRFRDSQSGRWLGDEALACSEIRSFGGHDLG